MPDKTRGERIGRAAFDDAFKGIGGIHWDETSAGTRKNWISNSLAAVAEARRIDTCDTCKYRDDDDKLWCYLHDCAAVLPIGGCGCNRHEPKGE